MFHSRSSKTQQGSALIIGIFVIIVMFLLAASLLRIVDDADESFSMEVWGARAFNSANSGADAALAQLFPVNGVPQDCSSVSTSWTPPNSVGFHGCSVTISCKMVTVGTRSQFTINSNASCETGGCGSDSTTDCLRVNRQVEVEARGN
ncbi:MSHA biogenesis protein MshP [Shewanella intestini]|uniref:MSHA biogenesis protein MshP n=1 Tax=Shewanella intestini TaxID=2017544 RepID=A0ABS5I419_9GAMM|nr:MULTISPECIES: MSHA biogenesis protein MshP [Shewanella]MBR9728776.1 MSHA biogenesis protein MshP [Shewanella intestini]MRG36851.1 MSHA biogenesis protein MshP [Shewanella sp. XMDDZSB0408]